MRLIILNLKGNVFVLILHAHRNHVLQVKEAALEAMVAVSAAHVIVRLVIALETAPSAIVLLANAKSVAVAALVVAIAVVLAALIVVVFVAIKIAIK